jgi:extracellular matrix regulatory protein A
MSNKDSKISWAKGSKGMLNLGHDNFVRSERVVAVMEASSLPMKRLRDKASQEGRLIDATAGRRTKAVLVTDTQHVFLSALSPHTLQDRLVEKEQLPTLAQLELEEGEFAS